MGGDLVAGVENLGHGLRDADMGVTRFIFVRPDNEFVVLQSPGEVIQSRQAGVREADDRFGRSRVQVGQNAQLVLGGTERLPRMRPAAVGAQQPGDASQKRLDLRPVTKESCHVAFAASVSATDLV